MHPVIRIVCFLLFGVLLATGGYSELLAALLLLSMGYLRASRDDLVQGLRLVRRIRWLLLSVLLIYLAFTPGAPVSDVAGLWLPSRAGIVQGLLRMAILVALLLAVNLLLRRTDQAEMISALLSLLKPLGWFGHMHERIAVRITLSLQIVTEVQLLHSLQGAPADAGQDDTGLRQRIRAFGNRAGDLFGEVLRRAHSSPVPEIELRQTPIPPAHWCWPMVLLSAFLLARYLA